MAHDDSVKVALRGAYLSGNLDLPQAAEKAGVPLPTARRWKAEAAKAGDDWDKLRGAALLSAGGGMEQALSRVIASLVLQAESTIELIATADMEPLARTQAIASLTDSLTKAQAAGRRLMTETDRLGVATDVVKRLAEFIRSKHPRHANAFAEVLEPFAAELAKVYG